MEQLSDRERESIGSLLSALEWEHDEVEPSPLAERFAAWADELRRLLTANGSRA